MKPTHSIAHPQAPPEAVAAMAAAIRSYLRERPPRSVSFLNLEAGVNGFKGNDCAWEVEGKVVLWPYLAAAAARAMVQLKRSGELVLDPCSPLIYRIDGEPPDLPICRRVPPTGGFKRGHWVPLLISLAGHPRPGGSRA